MEDYSKEDALGQLIIKEEELTVLLIFMITKYLCIKLNFIAALL
jgi:hypothetical protein